MKFEFLGAAQEVGRSCIIIDDQYLLDCGLKIDPEGNQFPKIHSNLSKIKGVFLSHAHLDHTGALPLFNHKGMKCPIYCTQMTKQLAKLLLEDSLKIEIIKDERSGYTKENIRNVLGLMQIAQYDRWREFKDGRFKLLYSGHIPGSSSIIIEYKGKRILYTGDINLTETQLLSPLTYHNNLKDIDVVLVESTYGDEDHPPREKVEKEFVDELKDILKNGGKAIIPAFAVGRAQEIIMLLHKENLNVPIYLDGMSKKVSNIILSKPNSIKDYDEFKEAMNNVKFVTSKSRKEVSEKRGIFVTTSGMITGGPVIEYLKHCYKDSRCGVLLTGYQSEDSGGRMLLEEGKVDLDGDIVQFQGFVKKYDFSGHADQSQLIEFINKINPKNVFIQHGDPDSVIGLKDELKGNVFTPKVGDIVNIE